MVSVCMATYNGEKYIKEQIDSILIQLSDEDELIISDDSSSDRTVEIIKSYDDKRIKIIANQKFQSPILNFENALNYAKGNYIFLSDQDDVWGKNKVERMVEELHRYDLVVCNCKWFGEMSNNQVKSNFEFRNSGKGVVKNILVNGYLGNCMAFRKDVLSKALPFPKDIPMHDIWIGLIANVYFEVKFLDEILSYWRRHGTNTTQLDGLKSPNKVGTKIRYRLALIKNLSLSFLR